MIVKAEGKFLRISPTKVRRVINLLRGKDALFARSILLNLRVRSGDHLKKILDSAIANAKVKGFGVEQLYISKIICDGGPTWKRYKATAFGRATLIRRRTAHIRIELELKT
ncbi:MAG: 50S ribosomal protein L22 [Candidatus Omnitrophota bacterium]|jgi:large subunit ribosomal protein L22